MWDQREPLSRREHRNPRTFPRLLGAWRTVCSVDAYSIPSKGLLDCSVTAAPAAIAGSL